MNRDELSELYDDTQEKRMLVLNKAYGRLIDELSGGVTPLRIMAIAQLIRLIDDDLSADKGNITINSNSDIDVEKIANNLQRALKDITLNNVVVR